MEWTERRKKRGRDRYTHKKISCSKNVEHIIWILTWKKNQKTSTIKMTDCGAGGIAHWAGAHALCAGELGSVFSTASPPEY